MMPTNAPIPGQIQSPAPIGNPAPPHSMAPSQMGQRQPMAPNPGGVPSGMRGLPAGITPEMLQNPQFLSMLQQMLAQQQQIGSQPQSNGFSKTIIGR